MSNFCIPIPFLNNCDDDSTTTTRAPRTTTTRDVTSTAETTTTRQGFFSSVISQFLPTFSTTSSTPTTTSTFTTPTPITMSSRSSLTSLTPTLPPVSTSFTTSLPTSSTSASATSSNSNGGKTSTGLVIGASIGGIVAAVILAVLVGRLLSYRKHQREMREEREAATFDPWVGGDGEGGGVAAAAATGVARRSSRASSDGAGAPLAVHKRGTSQSQNRRSGDNWQQFRGQSGSSGEEMAYAHNQAQHHHQQPQFAGYGSQPQMAPNHSAPFMQPWSGAPALPPPAPIGSAGRAWGSGDPYGRPQWTGNPAMSAPGYGPTSRPQGFESLPIGAAQPVAYNGQQGGQYGNQNKSLPVPNYDQRRVSDGSVYGGMN